MAHTITKQTIVDGRRITIVKIAIKGDGSSGELSNATLFTASDYSTASKDNKLMEIHYNFNGFTAQLFWDATSPVPLISITKDYPNYESYYNFGGIVNNAGAGRTGNINITTAGLASSTFDGYIILYMMQRKVPKTGQI